MPTDESLARRAVIVAPKLSSGKSIQAVDGYNERLKLIPPKKSTVRIDPRV